MSEPGAGRSSSSLLARLRSGGAGALAYGTPLPRLPHLDDPAFEARHIGAGEAPDDAAQLFIFRDVLLELRYRSVFAPDEASACLLTGGWFVGPHGPFVEMDGFRDAVHVSGALDFVHYLRDHRELVTPRETVSTREAQVVGCCLLQPHSGARFTAEHLILLNTFFPRPMHVLLLIDPHDGSLGFYARSAAAGVHDVPFVLLSVPGSEAAEREGG